MERVMYYIFGICFLIIGAFFQFVAFMAEARPVPESYIIFALAVVCLSTGYLQPQFSQKDERSKMIRQKGTFYSYFIFVIYYFLFSYLLSRGIVDLSAREVLNMYVTLMVCTVFSSFVIVSKVH
ncbi:permease [Evansella tamaricis]|uniref:Permease n=1 Tax=Evansella tamaricis TaxID=2069301 RepID=A0ABS6JKM8_9BACI|nr:permease [Evansella tamaricis]MBU9714241.1 permease [Evansella tamaricis]